MDEISILGAWQAVVDACIYAHPSEVYLYANLRSKIGGEYLRHDQNNHILSFRKDNFLVEVGYVVEAGFGMVSGIRISKVYAGRVVEVAVKPYYNVFNWV